MPSSKPKSNRYRWLSALVGIAAVLMLNAAPALAVGPFELELFDSVNFDEASQADTQAGSHPFGSTVRLNFSKTDNHANQGIKDIQVDLPPGQVGNPQVLGECSGATFSSLETGRNPCPVSSQVGMVAFDPGTVKRMIPIFNLEPQKGTVAQFGFKPYNVPVVLTARLRPYDYGVTFTARNIPSIQPPSYTSTLFWGVPADPEHDTSRSGDLTFDCREDYTYPDSPRGCSGPTPAGVPPRPFLSNPQDCSAGPLTTSATINSWENPDLFKTRTVLSHDLETPANAIGFTGCDRLPFDPRIEARATTPLADSPSGLDVNIHVPQSEDPDGLATAYMKKVVVDLPQGISVNPSSANGLGACSPEQMGMSTAVGNPDAHFNGNPVTCPDNSRLGTVESISPAIDHPLPGSIYLAEQNNNPFNSLLALYVVVDDPQTGVRVKLAAKVEPDPQTGQLRTIFPNNPQLPVENFEFNFFTGPRAPLRTPLACGTYTSTVDITPWTTPYGANAVRKDSFAISQGAGGGACVGGESQAPNAPSFEAGTTDPTAGAYAPFALKLTRQDGTQPIKRIDATLPKGLLGKLAGIPYCSDQNLASAAGKSGKAEQSNPSCPSASQIGSVNVGSGAGSQPVYVEGKAYLAGPYKGAPLSMVFVTPVLAGPLDLGTVVVRTALKIDPNSTQIKALSDEIPTILQGIPLDIRSLDIRLDKPSFTLNPTSCEKTQVFASATSVFDQSAEVKSPFQVGGCAALGFKPKLAFALSGKTHRAGYPALKATLSARPGDANIARAQVTLPKSQFLAQDHIRTICTRVQYAANACPAASVYGKAKAWSPLLDQPLSGPVYLRSSNNPLPDLVAKLDGQIHLDLVGRIDAVNERLRSTFDYVPDAPVSKFILEMQGGKKGLLVNNTELCKVKPKASVKLDGQSGAAYDFNPVVKVDCGKKKAKKKGGKKGKGSKRGGGAKK